MLAILMLRILCIMFVHLLLTMFIVCENWFKLVQCMEREIS